MNSYGMIAILVLGLGLSACNKSNDDSSSGGPAPVSIPEKLNETPIPGEPVSDNQKLLIQQRFAKFEPLRGADYLTESSNAPSNMKTKSLFSIIGDSVLRSARTPTPDQQALMNELKAKCEISPSKTTSSGDGSAAPGSTRTTTTTSSVAGANCPIVANSLSEMSTTLTVVNPPSFGEGIITGTVSQKLNVLSAEMQNRYQVLGKELGLNINGAFRVQDSETKFYILATGTYVMKLVNSSIVADVSFENMQAQKVNQSEMGSVMRATFDFDGLKWGITIVRKTVNDQDEAHYFLNGTEMSEAAFQQIFPGLAN